MTRWHWQSKLKRESGRGANWFGCVPAVAEAWRPVRMSEKRTKSQMARPLSAASQRELDELLAFLDGNDRYLNSLSAHLRGVELATCGWLRLASSSSGPSSGRHFKSLTLLVDPLHQHGFAGRLASHLFDLLRFWSVTPLHLQRHSSGVLGNVLLGRNPLDQIKSFRIEWQPALILFDFLMVKAPSIRKRRFRLNATGTSPSALTLTTVVQTWRKLQRVRRTLRTLHSSKTSRL